MLNTRKTIFFALIIVAALTATICYVLFSNNGTPFSNIPLTAGLTQIPNATKDINLLFVGDLMFDRGIRYYAQKNGGNQFIFNEISSTLKSFDLVVANLEGPITDEQSISSGTVPGSPKNYFFTFDPSLAKTLYNENIRLVNLGNNHILNFGQEGLTTTKNYLSGASVGYFGGYNEDRGIMREISGVKIGFVSYNEFWNDDIYGEQQKTINEIINLKQKVDVVFVFSHWGVEYSPEPPETIQKVAYKFIDAGADLVIGSHPHVIETMEIYKGKRIYYSLGNFIFDQYFSKETQTGLGVSVKINKTTKQLEFEEKKFYLQSNGQTILAE